MNKKEIKIGQDITLVSKGITHNSYDSTTYITEDQVGNTHFFQVTKIGTTYIYGKYIRFELDGKREIYYWESKVNPEEYLIFNGIHEDLRKAYNDRKTLRDEYEKTRENTRRDIERKYDQLARQEYEQWTKDNPRPAPLDLSNLPFMELTQQRL